MSAGPAGDGEGRESAESLTARPWAQWLLILVAGVYWTVALMYAVRTPLWQAPDEPAHYNYVRDLALGRGLPVLTAEDWNAESGRLIRAGFPEGSSVDSFGYEAHQPPTYYAILASAEILLTDRPLEVQVYTLRMLGALLMLPVIALAWQVARRVLPNRRWLALGAAGFVALLPQAVAISASINNDVLGILAATSLLLWAVWTYQRGETRPSSNEGDRSPPWDRTVVVGALLVGFVLLSKTTAYSSLILVPVTLFLVARQRRLGIGWAGRSAIIILVAGLLIASPWFARNMIEYGPIDPLGQIRHDEIVVGQAAGRLDSVEGWLETITVSFRSFFIQLGWMSVPAQDRVYWMLLVLACVAVAGTVTSVARARGSPRAEVVILAVAAMVVAGALIYYNSRFFQPQGRYLFPALVPIAIVMIAGTAAWLPKRWRFAAPVVWLFALGYVNIIASTEMIPYLQRLPDA